MGLEVPFPFFCDFQGGLADAVRKGRRREYGWAYAKYGDGVPDPLAASTFQSAVVDWEYDARRPVPQKRLALVRELLAIRRREIVPRLAGAAFWRSAGDGQRPADGAVGGWATAQRCRLLANLSDQRHRRTRRASSREL